MKYKDLVYKITSKTHDERDMPKNYKQEKEDDGKELNSAKRSLSTDDIMIGIIVDEKTDLTSGMINFLKKKVETTLTVLLNSPISDDFAFLIYDLKALKPFLKMFPKKNIYFMATRENYKEAKKLKDEFMNFKDMFATTSINEDFLEKIDYLVTLNKELKGDFKEQLIKRDIMEFPVQFDGVENHSQGEKHVTPDPSGWIYNKANGMWTKNWGWDGHQELPSWETPDDWKLDPEPMPDRYNNI